MINLYLSIKTFPRILSPAILPLPSRYIHTAMRLQPIRVPENMTPLPHLVGQIHANQITIRPTRDDRPCYWWTA